MMATQLYPAAQPAKRRSCLATLSLLPSRYWQLLLLCLSLAACVSAPPAEDSDWTRQREQLQRLDSWQLSGRVNIRYDNESHTPRIRWQQQSLEYQIRLWGTFNAGNTLIVGRPGYVTMEQNSGILTASSPEDLILQQLGYELPVSYLEYWIKGLPAPDTPADLTFNELNQLTNLSQFGWSVSYTDPRQYGAVSLPRRVELTRPQNDIRLRFIGLNWDLSSATTVTANNSTN
jgi:outer membrane lipoprotein LolB